jgi:phosphate-selective porin OprO and OprP
MRTLDHSRSRWPFAAFAALAAGFTTSIPAFAADTNEQAEIASLRALISELDQKLRVLERKQELKDEETANASKAAAKITANDRGFTIASADGAHSLRLRGLVQADSRWFFGDDPALTNNDAFVLRRARLTFEGQFAKNTTFVVTPELAGSSPTLLDAYVNYAFKPALQLRAGRFKTPVGLEQLQSDANAFFTERSVASQLVPNRDVGLQLGGDVFNSTVNYAVGIFDGVSDGANNGAVVNSDADNRKDLAARVWFAPFKNDDVGSPLKGLGFGLGVSTGRQKPAAGLTSYRSDGQQTIFAYRTQSITAPVAPASATNYSAVIDGDVWRISPQASWYHGPFGVLAEYARSTINVRPNFPATLAGSPKVELTNDAWQLAAGYVLTGENASYTGVQPANNFSPAEDTWGALEIVARVGQFDFDDAGFITPGFGYAPLADPAANPTKLTTYGIGLNWYPAKALRASLNYFRTTFDNNVPVPTRPVLRNDESAVITRLQVSF